MTDRELEREYPWIAWREPWLVSVIEGPAGRLACRLCIARFGLRAEDVGQLPADREAFDRHMREAHQ